MKITKKIHKAFLTGQFYMENQMGQRQLKNFGVDKLDDASSTFKKLKADGKEEKNGEVIIGYTWNDGDIEFTVGEASFLKDLINGVREANVEQADTLKELKEILK